MKKGSRSSSQEKKNGNCSQNSIYINEASISNRSTTFPIHSSIKLKEMTSLDKIFPEEMKEGNRTSPGIKSINSRDVSVIVISVTSSGTSYDQIFSDKYYVSPLKFSGKIKDSDQQTMMLTFDIGDTKKHILLRSKLKYSSKENKNINKEDRKKWIFNQVEKCNNMIIASHNCCIVAPIDFYILHNETKHFYFADTLFEVNGSSLIDAPNCMDNNIFSVLQCLLKAFNHLEEVNMKLTMIDAKYIFIFKLSDILNFQMLPLGLESKRNIKAEKENNSLAINSLMKSSKGKNSINEIKCNLDPILVDFFQKVMVTLFNLDKIINHNTKENAVKYKHKRNFSEINNSDLEQRKSDIKKIGDFFLKGQAISLEILQKMIENVEKWSSLTKLYQSNHYSMDSNGNLAHFNLIPRNNFNNDQSSHYIRNEPSYDIQSNLSSIEEVNSKNNNSYLGNINLTYPNSTSIDHLIRKLTEELGSLKNPENNLNQRIKDLSDIIISFVNQKLDHQNNENIRKIFANDFEKLNREFNCLKQIVKNLGNENQCKISTEQILNNNSSQCKISFVLSPQEYFLNKRFCIVIDSLGEIYLGEYDSNSKNLSFKGFGIRIKFKNEMDNILYLGEFSSNMENGFGFEPNNFGCFVGFHKNNKKNGIGIFVHDNQTFRGGRYLDGDLTNEQIKGDKDSIFIGEIKGDKPDGQGELIRHKKFIYKGGFKDGLMEGRGKITYENGEYFDGFFHQSVLIEGKCKKNLDRSIYEGQIHNQELSGENCLITQNGIEYIGKVVKGKKEGYGKETYPNNGYYEGEWIDDKYHG